MHVNLVQFLYAAVIGLLLAFVLEKTGKLSMAVFGHIAANLAAVLRTETGWLDFSFYPTVKGILFTVVMAAAGIAVVSFFTGENNSLHKTTFHFIFHKKSL